VFPAGAGTEATTESDGAAAISAAGAAASVVVVVVVASWVAVDLSPNDRLAAWWGAKACAGEPQNRSADRTSAVLREGTNSLPGMTT
jgi:hypothetical protein